MTEREELIELLSRYFQIGDSYAYNLTRVKTAFEVGTMPLEDFEEFDEETVADIADHLLDHGVIVPPCKVGDTVYYMHNGGGRVYEGVVTSLIYVSDTKSFVIHCDGCHGKYGQYVFLTREEAEAALTERRKA